MFTPSTVRKYKKEGGRQGNREGEITVKESLDSTEVISGISSARRGSKEHIVRKNISIIGSLDM